MISEVLDDNLNTSLVVKPVEVTTSGALERFAIPFVGTFLFVCEVLSAVVAEDEVVSTCEIDVAFGRRVIISAISMPYSCGVVDDTNGVVVGCEVGLSLIRNSIGLSVVVIVGRATVDGFTILIVAKVSGLLISAVTLVKEIVEGNVDTNVLIVELIFSVVV